MKIGEKIARCRKRKGMSQEELAEQLELSRQAVSRWETGTAVPDTEKVILLSRLFGVTTDYLLLDELEEPDGILPVAEKGEEPSPQRDPIKERWRRLRIVCGIFGLLAGLALSILALIMAGDWARSTDWWYSDRGKFGTALTENWMGGALLLGALLFFGGAVFLAREYIVAAPEKKK